jgi:hypothetical protein
MATVSQVIAKAQKLGCSIDITDYDIAIKAPKGVLLGQDLHLSAYPFGEGYTRGEIWQNLLLELGNLSDCGGSAYCDCKE